MWKEHMPVGLLLDLLLLRFIYHLFYCHYFFNTFYSNILLFSSFHLILFYITVLRLRLVHRRHEHLTHSLTLCLCIFLFSLPCKLCWYREAFFTLHLLADADADAAAAAAAVDGALVDFLKVAYIGVNLQNEDMNLCA